jgi:predicted AlkP superfamily phosphohydrolase/phosphomutase
MVEGVGPMVDFVDNFPPQLIFYQEDKKTFLQEANMSLQWHKAAVPFVLGKYKPDIVMHDIYTPNQMLTSRWWLGYVDPKSSRYNEISKEERDRLWEEVQWMYKRLDDIMGKVLENVDENTLVVLSSDHGAIPLNKWVKLNNLLAKEGLLKFTIDGKTGEPVIDWNNSKAIYLKMDNIYVSPTGLGGNWHRSSGPEYEALRDKVTGLLYNLTEENGEKPVALVVKWEDVEQVLDLPTDRVGDLIIANKAGYGWNEEMSEDLKVFDTSLETGYKQAVLAENETGMWTPFVIMGPGVKKGYQIKEPFPLVDQYPTLMRLLDVPSPDFVEGRVIGEILVT